MDFAEHDLSVLLTNFFNAEKSSGSSSQSTNKSNRNKRKLSSSSTTTTTAATTTAKTTTASTTTTAATTTQSPSTSEQVGIWESAGEERVGVLIDSESLQIFREKRNGHIPEGLLEDPENWKFKRAIIDYTYQVKNNTVYMQLGSS